MAQRLAKIRNWPFLARQSGYKAARLAQMAGVSLKHLERFFKDYFHCSPRAWIAQTRLEHAAQLLRSGASTKEAAVAVGFHSSSCLCRFCKRQLGVTPTELVQRPNPESPTHPTTYLTAPGDGAQRADI